MTQQHATVWLQIMKNHQLLATRVCDYHIVMLWLYHPTTFISVKSTHLAQQHIKKYCTSVSIHPTPLRGRWSCTLCTSKRFAVVWTLIRGRWQSSSRHRLWDWRWVCTIHLLCVIIIDGNWYIAYWIMIFRLFTSFKYLSTLFSNNGLDLFLWTLFIPDTFVTKDKR